MQYLLHKSLSRKNQKYTHSFNKNKNGKYSNCSNQIHQKNPE